MPQNNLSHFLIFVFFMWTVTEWTKFFTLK